MMQAHTRVIMHEVCIWTRGYLEIRLKDYLGDPPAVTNAAAGRGYARAGDGSWAAVACESAADVADA